MKLREKTEMSPEGISLSIMPEVNSESDREDEEVKPVAKRSKSDRLPSGTFGSRDGFSGIDDCFKTRISYNGLQIVLMTNEQAYAAYDIFDDIRPKFVVLYDPDIRTIRQIEVYQAKRRAIVPDQIKVFFLMYDGSTEESKYLHVLGREKKSFEKLIQTKAHMVISLPDFAEMKADTHSLAMITDTRTTQNLSTQKHKPIKVVVDLREFRSQLPFLLHTSGLQIVPATITVGDYVLSSDICIERKGISDMFQSFASGRLYNQVEIMLRHYKISGLLIEFSADKRFCLQTPSDLTSEIRIDNVCSKLSLLILRFPALRILWSRGPHMTSEIFKALKQGRCDADVNLAMSIGNKSVLGTVRSDDDFDGEMSEKADAEAASNAAREMLLSLPGIDSKNYKTVMKNVSSMAELSRMNVHKLTPLIGPVNARSLVEFFQKRILKVRFGVLLIQH